MKAIDSYTADLADRLHVSRRVKRRIVEEIREHLIDASLRAQDAGATETEAATMAIDAFGSAEIIARHSNADAGARAVRRFPFLLLLAGLSVVAALVVVAHRQPLAADRASVAIQVAFFFGMLALQLAVVAGACAGLRALLVWRTAASHGSERALVRRCAVVSSTASTVSGLSFAATLALVHRRTNHPDATALVIAGCTMVIVSLAVLMITQRSKVNPFAESEVTDAAPNTLLGAGEAGLDLVREHPVAACSVFAVLAGWAAMSHAETTVVGSLPWVVTEVAAVVVLFATLGPTLGLRARHHRALH